MLYKRTGGNTTNLHKYLQKKHPSKVKTEVESSEIDKFIKKELPSIAKTPSADTLHNDIINKFNEERNKIREILQELKEILIDFCKLSGPHSGENLHEVFVKCCDNMRILTKIVACTTDNASNNDTLMKALEKTFRYIENKNELLNNDEVSEVIPKLRKLVIKIHAPSQRREKFSRQCEAAHLPDKELHQEIL
ncbi:zinc finger BED domain-containing protein RICESLEEPER 2-like [Rhizophagus clarus]|uniref:Zinc finger BED domain-containing protein RICESLEEPER 2-like n=1 Tax=Rhizophagus clarus TaxID=94130 RepID=A0A8H3QWH4_9GLOM|nr:zinc finger BED domain-containing protein RICESLEEPER 2-like [Rhizophagus clarus]